MIRFACIEKMNFYIESIFGEIAVVHCSIVWSVIFLEFFAIMIWDDAKVTLTEYNQQDPDPTL
jgi:hypothetical protein